MISAVQSPGPPSLPGERSLPIDMLRAVAILLVLGCHHVMAPASAGAVAPFAVGWWHIGWAGVDLFFVLSGYLVSGLLFAEYRRRRQLDVRRFLIRRGFKIWPAYAVYLAFLTCWLAYKEGWAGVESLWPNFIHLQNYFDTPRLHTWSLAVEEHFYAGVAFLLWWLTQRRRPEAAFAALPWVIATVIATVGVLRYLGFTRQGAGEINLVATHLRCDGLLAGTLIAWWQHFRPESFGRWTARPVLLLLGGIALAIPVLVTTPMANAWSASVGLSALYLGFALVVLAACGSSSSISRTRGPVPGLASRPARLLARIGFFSYGIYLWHVDLAQTPGKKIAARLLDMGATPELAWLVATGIYVVLAIVLGMALSWLIERPALALRDRLFPAAGGRPEATRSPPATRPPTPALAGTGPY